VSRDPRISAYARIPIASFIPPDLQLTLRLLLTNHIAADYRPARSRTKRSASRRDCLLTSTSRRVINLYRSRHRECFASNILLVAQLRRELRQNGDPTSTHRTNIDGYHLNFNGTRSYRQSLRIRAISTARRFASYTFLFLGKNTRIESMVSPQRNTHRVETTSSHHSASHGKSQDLINLSLSLSSDLESHRRCRQG